MKALLFSHDPDPRFLARCQEAAVQVVEATPAPDSMEKVLATQPELVVVDLDNDSTQGLALIEQLRQQHQHTALVAVASSGCALVSALENGADVFISKLSSCQELVAQFKALSRRCNIKWGHESHQAGDYSLSVRSKSLYFADQQVHLTPVEFQVLLCIFNGQGLAVTPESIISTLTQQGHQISHNALQVHLSYIRRKVRSQGGELPVINRRGLGYSTQS
ncbi:response regulator transcription factor [Gallaecimonas pentaromativorans]|uniref:DNA-binding response OmpR family regulator n=2 Tax=Gammaproteobacteria TaxID=1236 RepID=A0A3N1P674_9GAMM|nr:response regulator transcription factor [Gallaecimonas pentaromativorans]MED5525420.1 response regulator transcription factor [Pseudomonadota bacterium]ROQ27524.1 DNA-binding response OmpR family regulator [Gallaecimonas pentaromativorans]